MLAIKQHLFTPISRYKIQITIFIIISFYFVSRLTYLDADIPKWLECYYTPVDELMYVNTAFLSVNDYKPRVAEFKSLDPDHPFRTFQLTMHYSTVLGLKIFGNTFYGIRFGSVIMGLVVLILMFLMIKARFNYIYATACALFLLFDYHFLISNRIVEFTIHRMAGMIALIYSLTYPKHDSKNPGITYFILGLVTGALTHYIYLGNTFFLPAALLTITLTSPKKFIKYYVFGLILVSIPRLYSFIFDPYMIGVYKVAKNLVAGGNDASSGIIPFLRKLRTNVVWMNAGIFLRYNYELLNLFFYSFLFFICQTFFRGDKSRKRSILCTVIFSAIMIFSYYAIPSYESLVTPLFSLTAIVIFVFYYLVKNFHRILGFNKWNKMDVAFFSLFLFHFLQTIFVNDQPHKKLILILPIYLYFIIWALNELSSIALRIHSQNNHITKFLYYVPLMFFAPKIVASIIHIYPRVYQSPIYEYKNTMIKLNDYKNEVFLGGFSHAFMLYNQMHPLLQYYWQGMNDQNLFEERMKDLGTKYYPDSVTIDEYNEERVEKYKKLGYHFESIIYHSYDKPYMYDYAIYRFAPTVTHK